MRGCVYRRVRARVRWFLCALFRSGTWKLQVFPSPVCWSCAVGIMTWRIPPGECVFASQASSRRRLGCFPPPLCKRVTQWLGSIWVAFVRVCGSVCVESWEFAQMHPLYVFFFCVCLNVCVHMCVWAIFVAFVRKHPRCRTDSAGWRRKSRGSCTGSVSALLHRCHSVCRSFVCGCCGEAPAGWQEEFNSWRRAGDQFKAFHAMLISIFSFLIPAPSQYLFFF